MDGVLNTIIAHGDTIIVAIVALILGWERFRGGSSSLRKEIASDYKERNEQLEARLKDFQDQITKTNLTIAELRGTVTEKDKRIQELREDLQGRNPEMIKILKEIVTSNEQIAQFMKEMREDSNRQMAYQTNLLEKGKERNEKIDEASVAHDGEPIRVPKLK